jgi:hypothetical protein
VVQILSEEDVPMRTNTSVAGKQPSNSSDEMQTGKSDPFTIRDGRYVGSDGFVIPKNFGEFYDRFPQYVSEWIAKHWGKSAPKEDLEDWTQELLVHLSCLPQTSMYRQAGKEDIVATFDPLRHYGANEARFRNYVNLCLANKFKAMHSKRMKDAVCRPGNLALDLEKPDLCSADELCRKRSAYLRAAEKASEKQTHNQAFLREFLDFVEREDAAALSTIQA